VQETSQSQAAAGEMAAQNPAWAQFRLVAEKNRRPLTERAQVWVDRLDRRGALLRMSTPFIHGCHILMDVHNTTSKLVQLFLPGENPETLPELVLTGRVVAYRRDESAAEAGFLADVVWVDDTPAGERPGEMKRLMRLINRSGGEPWRA